MKINTENKQIEFAPDPKINQFIGDSDYCANQFQFDIGIIFLYDFAQCCYERTEMEMEMDELINIPFKRHYHHRYLLMLGIYIKIINKKYKPKGSYKIPKIINEKFYKTFKKQETLNEIMFLKKEISCFITKNKLVKFHNIKT